MFQLNIVSSQSTPSDMFLVKKKQVEFKGRKNGEKLAEIGSEEQIFYADQPLFPESILEASLPSTP